MMVQIPGKSQVKHSTDNSEFYVELPDGERAFVRYHLLDGNKVDFYRTFVPTSARGQGLAAVLVDYALDWAEHQDLEIKTSCWYAEKKLLQRNRD